MQQYSNNCEVSGLTEYDILVFALLLGISKNFRALQ